VAVAVLFNFPATATDCCHSPTKLFLENLFYIRPEILLALHHFSIFAENRFAVFIQLRHVAAVDFVEDFLNFMLQSVTENGAESDVQ